MGNKGPSGARYFCIFSLLNIQYTSRIRMHSLSVSERERESIVLLVHTNVDIAVVDRRLISPVGDIWKS